MANEEELTRLAEERKLIVSNLVCGVPPEIIAKTFHRSREEVMAEFAFAVRKIKSYSFERRLPAFLITTLPNAKREKVTFLFFLDRISFKTSPKFPKIGSEAITENNVKSL